MSCMLPLLITKLTANYSIKKELTDLVTKCSSERVNTISQNFSENLHKGRHQNSTGFKNPEVVWQLALVNNLHK